MSADDPEPGPPSDPESRPHRRRRPHRGRARSAADPPIDTNGAPLPGRPDTDYPPGEQDDRRPRAPQQGGTRPPQRQPQRERGPGDGGGGGGGRGRDQNRGPARGPSRGPTQGGGGGYGGGGGGGGYAGGGGYGGPPRGDRSGDRSGARRGRPGGGSSAARRKRDLLEGLKLLQRGTSIDPFERLVLETTPDQYSTRVFDLIAPIGRGQRCLITSPPKAGKTMILEAVARAVILNHPDVEVVCLLVDERPEEVTHFRRSVDCAVVASSNDQHPEEHVRVTEETIVKVAESVAAGRDVLLLLDSITRLARAYNLVSDGSGRTMSGGLDASTMYGPRRIFGAARKIEHGGSLTILGTALVDTGSRMDEVIFQEFKGTGNTEVVLSRDLANKRIFPAIDILQSGSRKEEKLYSAEDVRRLHVLRRFLAEKKSEAAMLGLLKMMERFKTNKELLAALG